MCALSRHDPDPVRRVTTLPRTCGWPHAWSYSESPDGTPSDMPRLWRGWRAVNRFRITGVRALVARSPTAVGRESAACRERSVRRRSRTSPVHAGRRRSRDARTQRRRKAAAVPWQLRGGSARVQSRSRGPRPGARAGTRPRCPSRDRRGRRKGRPSQSRFPATLFEDRPRRAAEVAALALVRGEVAAEGAQVRLHVGEAHGGGIAHETEQDRSVAEPRRPQDQPLGFEMPVWRQRSSMRPRGRPAKMWTWRCGTSWPECSPMLARMR